MHAQLSSHCKHDRQALQVRYDDLRRQINEETVKDYDAELVRRNLRSFQTAFEGLTPPERAEAPRGILKDVIVYPDRLVLNIFELPEFAQGPQNHTKWLPGCASIRTAEKDREAALCFRVVHTDWSTQRGHTEYQRKCITGG